jgi:hypothetical protein
MGFIFKFILIAIALSWIFSKLLQFFVKSKIKQFANHAQDLRREEERSRRPKNGNVNVDHVPDDFAARQAREIKGGDYIDYEEVKD